VTKEEIIAMVQELEAKLGRAPRSPEFYKHTRISAQQMRRNFGGFTRMLAASGVKWLGQGVSLPLKLLFLDWAEVTRKTGKIPTKADYAMEGRYSVQPYIRRYKSWANVPQGMQDFAIRDGLQDEWQDVLKIIREHLKDAGTSPGAADGRRRKGRRADRPVYGRPMFAPFSFAPINEQGVLFVFGVVAQELGFTITRVQTEFPDVEAMRETGPNQCQRMHLELEYESRNFLTHMHPLDGCDGIVCWIDNWPECPLEVIELKSVVEKLAVKKS
jgi:hypothetical protein